MTAPALPPREARGSPPGFEGMEGSPTGEPTRAQREGACPALRAWKVRRRRTHPHCPRAKREGARPALRAWKVRRRRTHPPGESERSTMSRYTRDDIRKIVEEEDVEFIRLQFSDIFGSPKNLAITASQLEKALDNGCMFDASAIEGFRDTFSALYLHPDLDTFDIYPWRPQTGKVARLNCDIYTAEGQPFDGDSRQILAKVLKDAAQMGLYFEIFPELEFFLFHTDDNGHPTTETHEDAGYFDVAPLDLAENVRRDIILTLEEMNFEVESSHHEISPAQHEIDFAADSADRVADKILTFKMAVKTIAKKHGLYATFLPKPTEGVNGSGMHMNFYCRDAFGKNLFYDADDEEGLSQMAYHFIAGLLEHSRALTLITNPIVNSYKRLVPGFDAPTGIGWSDNLANRSLVINIPCQRENETRVEYRSPDGVCNPYLAFAACIAAGLDGIRRELVPPAVIHERIDEIPASGGNSGVKGKLPETLGEAMEAYLADPLMKEVLGEFIYNQFLFEKQQEWKSFRSVVTNWEIENYLGKY